MDVLLAQVSTRNRRECTPLVEKVLASYQKALQRVDNLESACLRLEKGAATPLSTASLEAQQRVMESTELALTLREELVTVKQELFTCRIELEKSQNAMEIDTQRCQVLEEEMNELRSWTEQQTKEVETLRGIQDSQRSVIHQLREENNTFISHIIRLKNQHAELVNDMNSMIQARGGDPVDIEDGLDFSTPSELEVSLQVGTPSPTQVIRELPHSEEVACLTMDASGRRMLTGGKDHLVRLWSISEGICSQELKGPTKAIMSVDLSLDGTMCLAAGQDPSIYLWSLKSHKITHNLNGHLSKVTTALFTSDSKSVLSGSYDRTVRVWDINSSFQSAQTWNCVSSCNGLSLSSDGNTLGSGHLDKHLRIWSLRTGELVRDITGLHTKPIVSLEFSKVGSLAVTLGRDSQLSVVDLRTYRTLRKLSHKEFKYYGNSWSHFGLSPDGRYAAVGSQDNNLWIFDIETGETIDCLIHHRAPITSCCWSASGLRVASASEDGQVAVWS